MPPEQSIYDVAFGAGAETGKYGAELLKTEDIWERMAHQEKVTDWKIEEGVAMADTAMATLGLASELYGGFAAKKDFESALADTSQRAAETAWDKTKETKWSELGPAKQEEWVAKFAPEKKPQAWYKSLFGEEEEYRFGKSEYFKKSSITASQALSEATSLEEMANVEGWASKATMADDAGISDEATTLFPEEIAAIKRSGGEPDLKEVKKTPKEVKKTTGASGEDLLKWGRTFQQWGAEGPRTGGAISPEKAGEMGKFQEFIKSFDIDIGSSGTIKSWGPKTQTEYSKLYKQWESIGK